MDRPRVDNRTDLLAEPFTLVGRDGERLVMIVKVTFVVRAGEPPELARRSDARAIRSTDIPWGDPEKSSIRYPSDLCIAKPGTDVIVVAAAHALGEPVPWFDAGVRVGPLDKTIRVFGLRAWEADGAGLSAPRLTTGMEVRYDFAWGGFDASDPANPVEEPRNPVGMGVARETSALTDRPAPSIEDPANLIASARTRPPPAGLGAIGRHWEPRRAFMGTFDAAWLAERAPLLPLDHDDRANLCASSGLTATPPLRGGEPVALLNLTRRRPSVAFDLPAVRVSTTLGVKGQAPRALTPHLDTVVLDTIAVPDGVDVLVEMVWRAAYPAPRRMRDATLVVTAEELG